MPFSKPAFDKPYRSVSEQLERLEERCLRIDIARSDALRILESITYYRFSGYALAFLGPDDTYTGELKFTDILALYQFDAHLRGLLVSALSAVEVTFRAIVTNELASKYGPLGYLASGNFSHDALHGKVLEKIRSEFERSRQPCAEHFRSTYDAPPIWALADITTFGTMSMLLKIMKHEDQNLLSTHYGMRGDYLASYMQHATVLRNLCAHHYRVFDFPYSRLKAPPREYLFKPLNEWRLAHLQIRSDRPLLYQAALIHRLLRPTSEKLFSRNEWRNRICRLFKMLPPILERRVRGYIEFPDDAESSPLWV